MPARANGIVTGYAKMWPREIFDAKTGQSLLARGCEFLREKGVYILYRNEHPYYIGKTERSLFGRLRGHAIKPEARYYNFWNMFSAFAVPDRTKRDELEAILIAAMPTVNSAEPKLNKMRLPREVVQFQKNLRATKVKDALGANPNKTKK